MGALTQTAPPPPTPASATFMSKLNPRFKFILIDSIQSTRNAASAAFTLVELMIVVAIVGLLSAAALPQFLSARDRADAKAKVGELVGIAKECSTFNAEADITPTTITGPLTANVVVCGGSSPSERSMTSRSWRVNVPVQCLGTTLTSTVVKMVISNAGRMVCSI